METIRIGIIGLGGAARQMVPAFVKHGGFKIAAGADIDGDVLSTYEKDFGAVVSSNPTDVFNNPDVDAVYIATPNPLHAPQTEMALDCGKHVVLEKPMALTMDDALRMCRSADDKGLQLLINEPYSFTPALRTIRDIVTGGEYGPLRMVHSWIYNDWLYRPRTPDELNPDMGGGVLYRQGPHQFDLLRMIGGGMVRSVRGVGGTWDPSRPVPGSYSVFMEFADGAVATAVYNGYDRLHTVDFALRSIEENPAVGRRAYARSRKALLKTRSPEDEEAAKRARRYGSGWTEPGGGGNLEWLFTGLTVASCDGCDILLGPEGLSLMTNDESRQLSLPADVTGRDSIAAQLYDAVVKGEAPGSTGWWGAATLEVSLAAIQSAEDHQEISLAHQLPPYA
jgi:phthalate 4,5-cis-dihydrodiol dehydrogenase